MSSSSITKTQSTPYGKLALEFCGKRLNLQVMASAAGYYIGTCDEDGPCSRESLSYYRHRAEAEEALLKGTWVQKPYP